MSINEQIRDGEVRLIDVGGEQLGVVSNAKAQALAMQRELDLVKISPKAVPPVCKIMDYSKYKFEQQKRDKEAKKKQRTVTLKELRLSPNIDKHDVGVKVKRAIEFLKNKDKVKVSIRFRGRELSYTNASMDIFKNFASEVSEFGQIEQEPKMDARVMSMVLSPVAAKEKK